MQTMSKKLDILIATKVMGLELWPGREDAVKAPIVLAYDTPKPCAPPSYSTDIRAAWSAVQYLIDNGQHVDIAFYPESLGDQHGPAYAAHWAVTGMYSYKLPKATADTAAKAICLAALKYAKVDYEE